MKKSILIFFLFIATGCTMSQGFPRDYIISQQENEEIAADLLDHNNMEDNEALSF